VAKYRHPARQAAPRPAQNRRGSRPSGFGRWSKTEKSAACNSLSLSEKDKKYAFTT
jgi:hypothetical protein